MEKRLTKSRVNKKWLGVCEGLGKYLEIDPTIFRLLFVLTTLFVGGGLIAYIAMALVMPYEDQVS